MSTIQRWDTPQYDDIGMQENPEGDYVLFEDHAAEIILLRAELDRAKKESIESYKKGILAAARNLEEHHWNDSITMTNQRDQAFRSASVLRRLVQPETP